MQTTKTSDKVKRKGKRLRGRKDSKSTIQLLLMALPAMLLLFAFFYVPMPGLVLAFKNYSFRKGIWGSEWCNFDNFKFVFSSSVSLNALRNTVLYNLAFIVIGLVTGVGLALIMNNIVSKKALRIYQTAIFIPHYLSWSIIAYVLVAFLSNGSGIINSFLKSIGLERIAFYDEKKWWPFILIFMHFWKGFGYSTLLYYARMLSIDPTYYEAASLDGANRFQQAWHITIPSLAPIILITLINSIGRIFNSDFSMFWMLPMEGSLISDVTSTLDTYSYSALRGGTGIGMAAAAGLFQSVAGLVLILICNTFIRKKFGADKAMF